MATSGLYKDFVITTREEAKGLALIVVKIYESLLSNKESVKLKRFSLPDKSNKDLLQ